MRRGTVTLHMDDTCPCCGSTDDADEPTDGIGATTVEQTPDADVDPLVDRLLSGDTPLASSLPEDLESALGALVGEPPVTTLEEWVDLIRESIGGGAISVADLCHVEEETPHWGDVDGDRYHFACFYDAVILSGLVDRPVDVHTESPEGGIVEARAVGTEDLSVDPSEAVFSLGCATDADRSDDADPSHELIYEAVCPYVRAFPNVAAYDRWRRTVPAATVATSLSGATDLAAALVASDDDR